MRVARAVPIIVVLIALVGCGGSKTLTAADLSSILPSKADTPSGLMFLPDSSGPQTLQLIANDSDQETKLTSFGFLGAYATFYANQGALAVLKQEQTPADPAAHVVTMLGVVFKTADGAHKALMLDYQKDVALGKNIKRVSVGKMGDETIAESGTQANFQFPGYLMYWRVGNAIFAVFDAGGPTAPVTLEAVQGYARAMQARAQKI